MRPVERPGAGFPERVRASAHPPLGSGGPRSAPAGWSARSPASRPSGIRRLRPGRGSPRWALRHILSAVLAVLLALALSHPVGTSTSEISLGREGIEATARFALADVARIGRLDRNGDGRLEEAELRAVGPAAASEILDHFSFLQAGERCRLEPASLAARLEPPDGVAVSGRWICRRPGEAAQLRLGLLGGLPSGHVHMVRVLGDAGVQERLLANHSLRARAAAG